jgi:hypothetical protein
LQPEHEVGDNAALECTLPRCDSLARNANGALPVGICCREAALYSYPQQG